MDAQAGQASLAARSQCPSLPGLQVLKAGTTLGAKPAGVSDQGNRKDKTG